MKYSYIWLCIVTPWLAAMETVVPMTKVKSTADLLNEENLNRAISNYFRTHDAELCNHIAEPLKRKIEESSGEGLETTTSYARDSNDIEKLTQSLITDLLKEALQAKNEHDSQQESSQSASLNRAKYLFYMAGASAISTLTGVLITYFAKS